MKNEIHTPYIILHTSHLTEQTCWMVLVLVVCCMSVRKMIIMTCHSIPLIYSKDKDGSEQHSSNSYHLLENMIQTSNY